MHVKNLLLRPEKLLTHKNNAFSGRKRACRT